MHRTFRPRKPENGGKVGFMVLACHLSKALNECSARPGWPFSEGAEVIKLPIEGSLTIPTAGIQRV